MSNYILALFIVTHCLHASMWKTIKENSFSTFKKDQLILIKVYREQCQYCKYMKEHVFSDSFVEENLKKSFKLFAVNIDHQKLPFALKSEVVPSFFLINKEGRVYKKILGALKKEDFMSLLKPYLKEKQ